MACSSGQSNAETLEGFHEVNLASPTTPDLQVSPVRSCVSLFCVITSGFLCFRRPAEPSGAAPPRPSQHPAHLPVPHALRGRPRLPAGRPAPHAAGLLHAAAQPQWKVQKSTRIDHQLDIFLMEKSDLLLNLFYREIIQRFLFWTPF